MDNRNDSPTPKKATRFWWIICLVVIVASIIMYKVWRQGLNDGAALAHQIPK